MDGALGFAIGALLVIGVCIQLAIALRNRYIKVYPDAEKDEENFATELELQLQGELDDAIKSSTPFLSPVKDSLVDTSTAKSPLQVRFAEGTEDESSWTTFKRESRAKLEQFAKTLNILSKDDALIDDADPNVNLATPHGHLQPSMTEIQHPRSVRRQLPLLDSDGALAEKAILVNAKQYSRILKRRLARQLMEDYFRSQPKRKVAASNGSVRRPRGPTGRFLTVDEIRQLESGRSDSGLVAAQ